MIAKEEWKRHCRNTEYFQNNKRLGDLWQDNSLFIYSRWNQLQQVDINRFNFTVSVNNITSTHMLLRRYMERFGLISLIIIMLWPGNFDKFPSHIHADENEG